MLFRLNPERAHHLTLRLMHLFGEIQPISALIHSIYSAPDHPVQAFGLSFCNPIGLAAGYDKDGLGWCGLASLGFSHIEIGTVTPRAQPGNPKPRLFRLTKEKALINRLGFPGMGAEFVLKQISRPHPEKFVLGVNIGKNQETPLEAAVEDYLFLLNIFAKYVDYVSVNVSSPNTVGLRQLQERQALSQLLKQVDKERARLQKIHIHRLPILVKLSPDLKDRQLEEALEVILENRMDGVIATNTTVKRDGLKNKIAKENGGLSGMPLFARSLAMVSKIHEWTKGKLPIIGVGGISDGKRLRKMLDAGASLVQVYTGLVYEGPGLIKKLLHQLDQ